MDNLKENLHKAVGTAREVVNEAVRKTEEFLDSAEVKTKVEELKDLAEDKAEGLADRAEELKDVLEDKFEDFVDRAEELKDKVEDKAEALADKLENKAGVLKDKLEGLLRKE